MLLYSLQHQLPTRSVLHHDDHSHLQYTVELHWSGKERRNKGITDTCTCTHKKENSLIHTLVLQRMHVSTPHTPTSSICFDATTSSVPSTDYLNTLLIYCLSNQQHKYQLSSLKYRVWMEKMCTSCSCSKHTYSLKALFLHIKGCDNLCLVGTLLSITCPTFF